MCGPMTLPPEKFAELRSFPDPLVRPDNREHYRSFADSWGVRTTEADRPSSKVPSRQGPAKSEVRGVPCRLEYVRSVVHCCECEKPRCVFVAQKLAPGQLLALQQALDDNMYVCGALLFPPGHELYSKVVVREDAECTTVIEPSYYSARCGYPKICYVCGHKSPLAMVAATLERYQTVHPVCSACRGKGRVERTRGEKKGKKRKHD